jgi:hypothetical protein
MQSTALTYNIKFHFNIIHILTSVYSKLSLRFRFLDGMLKPFVRKETLP